MKVEKSLKAKILLVVIVQLIGFGIASLLSLGGIVVERSTLSYFITGTILAFIALGIYEYILTRNATKLQKELSVTINQAMRRYDTIFINTHTEKKGGK
ncbi:membrane protein [Bacillus phage vB_BcgM]|nr:membrane protein [Bacillus phage vB_BcgM]